MHSDLTRHALERCSSRGISQAFAEVVLRFGTEVPAGRGCSRVFLDKKGKRAAKAFLGPLAKALDDKDWSAYLIVAADQSVVTVAYNYH